MIFWLIFRVISHIIVAISIILLIRRRPIKLALLIGSSGISLSIITSIGCFYFAPSYANVPVSHNNYILIQKSLKNEQEMLAISANSSEEINSNGQLAAKNLNSIIINTSKTSVDRQYLRKINNNINYDIQLPIINSDNLQEMIKCYNKNISQKVTPKFMPSNARTKIYTQMNKDANRH